MGTRAVIRASVHAIGAEQNCQRGVDPKTPTKAKKEKCGPSALIGGLFAGIGWLEKASGKRR